MEREIYPRRTVAVFRKYLRDDVRRAPISRHGRAHWRNVADDRVGSVRHHLLATQTPVNQSLMAFATPSAASSWT
jgi:hypothetical protein